MKKWDFNWINDVIEENIQDIIERISEEEELSREELLEMAEDLWAQHLEITAQEINDHVGDYVMGRIREAIDSMGK